MELSEQQARLEQVGFNSSLLKLIQLGARSAQLLYALNSENADKLAGKAWEAYEQARIDFKEIAGKELRHSLRVKRNQIRAEQNQAVADSPFRKARHLGQSSGCSSIAYVSPRLASCCALASASPRESKRSQSNLPLLQRM